MPRLMCVPSVSQYAYHRLTEIRLSVLAEHQSPFQPVRPTITTARDWLGGFIGRCTLFSRTHAGRPKAHGLSRCSPSICYGCPR